MEHHTLHVTMNKDIRVGCHLNHLHNHQSGAQDQGTGIFMSYVQLVLLWLPYVETQLNGELSRHFLRTHRHINV